ncbi:hypothetical protein [Vampirovibrio sp.]|uniref:hypothetical protein n=1 Tax=Vampirovibrio sp. TaxID=2717857 RepID=UPI003593043B
MRKLVKSGLFWNKLPQLLNLARYRMLSTQQEAVLDYEPLHLSINPLETWPQLALSQSTRLETENAKLDKDTFRFLLEQVPSIRTIEFSCQKADPLEMPDLFRLIDYAYQFNGTESTVITEGWHLASRMSDILSSRLSTLVIPLGAHRPSQYFRMTRRPMQHFVTLKNMIEELVRLKKSENPMLDIELVMRVDIHNYREMPEMISFSENLGVNGLRFETYYDPVQDPSLERTLFSDIKPVVRFLEWMRTTVLPVSRLSVELPPLLDRDMREHRHCLDAYSIVSVDAELNVSGCSRHLLTYPTLGKIWDENFFNNPMYQWMRAIHCKNTASEIREAVPVACQSCARNLPRDGSPSCALK